jgi:hypothetical protein
VAIPISAHLRKSLDLVGLQRQDDTFGLLQRIAEVRARAGGLRGAGVEPLAQIISVGAAAHRKIPLTPSSAATGVEARAPADSAGMVTITRQTGPA